MKISIPKVLIAAAIVSGFVGGVFLGSQQFKPSLAESSNACTSGSITSIDVTTSTGCAEPVATPAPSASPVVATPLTTATTQPASTQPKSTCQ